MSHIFLFCINVLIWGSTWLAIKYQVDAVSPIWSVVYRFSLAVVLLLLFCTLTKRKLSFAWRLHPLMALQGLLLFCLNYILYYVATTYLISGLVALIGASAIFFNIVNARLFFNMPIVARVVTGACLGMIGLAIVLSGELAQMYQRAGGLTNLWIGIGCCLVATLSASFGNMVAVRLNQLQLPILQSATISMCYGSVFSCIVALLSQQSPTISLTPSYLFSLLYLTILGTIVAFGCYLTLLSRIGPAKTSYISIVTPVIAMLLSTFCEGFVWKLSTLAGIALILYGNIMVLTRGKARAELA
jgi:drug/metabolite transporter (DMT)-like permease